MLEEWDGPGLAAERVVQDVVHKVRGQGIICQVSYRAFQDRHCHACPGTAVDSAHYLAACPFVGQAALDIHLPVANLLRQLCLPKWSLLPTSVQLSILAGSILPTIWNSNQAAQWHWSTQLTPYAALLAFRIDQQLKLALPSNP